MQLRAEDLRGYIEREGTNIPTIGRQAELLGISRSSVYYEPVPVDEATLRVMHRIDEIYTKRPFYGVRRIIEDLQDEGYVVNHKKVQRLMQEMGIAGLIPKPNLSRNTQAHIVYPYLLRGVIAGRPNHIWGTDITYIRMQHGFLYLVVFLDWYSRYVVSWRLSNSLEKTFCIEAAKEALTIAIPEITNSDQGVQFTSQEYLDIWETNNVRISMDGRGRAMDNIFTERFWRSLKYEEVYLKSYATGHEAYENVKAYMQFYNNERKHQSHGYITPAKMYEKH